MRFEHRASVAALVAALALAVVAMPGAAQDGPPAPASTQNDVTILGSKTLEPCHLPRHRQEVLCGSHRVFEDRAAGREIDIHFAVMLAVGEKPEPDPVVVFAGGPGQAATEMAPFISRAFAEVLEARDIVLIDQRGMGESHPLECELPDDELDSTPERLRQRVGEILRECIESWDADPRLYTQDLANEDIHEILEALGYSRVNLFGASWGTRSALLYAHRYPQQVRTLVLDGALPLQNTAPLHAGEDGERALRALFEDCAADDACAAAFPELEADYERAAALLEEGGGPTITVDDPVSAEPQDVVLTAGVFGGLIRNALYIPELGRVVPLVIHRAAEGDYDALFGVSSYMASASGDSMTPGSSLAIFCAEEMLRAKGAEPAPALIGHELLESVRAGCRAFESEGVTFAVPSIYAEMESGDVLSGAPALVLSGARDPITPPRWGEEMAKSFAESLHLVAPATGHNVSPVGCAPELIHQFIAEGGFTELDGSCLEELERPSFFVDASGPSMAPRGGAR